jgi:hypothetical protein
MRVNVRLKQRVDPVAARTVWRLLFGQSTPVPSGHAAFPQEGEPDGKEGERLTDTCSA